MPEHVPQVLFHRGWHEWRADCSCGFVGSYLRTNAGAWQEFYDHVERETSGAVNQQIMDAVRVNNQDAISVERWSAEGRKERDW